MEPAEISSLDGEFGNAGRRGLPWPTRQANGGRPTRPRPARPGRQAGPPGARRPLPPRPAAPGPPPGPGRPAGHAAGATSALGGSPEEERAGAASAYGRPAPEVVRIAAGAETGRLRGRRRVGEAAGDGRRPVRVAAEDQRFTAGL